MIECIETEDGHYYELDGQRVPGVSEILEANDVMLKNSYYEEAREAAAIRGTEVHLACADMDTGGPDWWTGSDIEGYVNAYRKFSEDFSFKPSAVEQVQYHEVYRYACRPDRYGQILTPAGVDRNVTVELKATVKIYPHVDLQIAAQNLMTEDWEDRQLMAVRLKPDGEYNIHWVKEPRQCERVFLAMLTVFNWKRRYQ